jgi:pimeloyl-ACP methyl ester carboxylesterase
MRAVVNGVGIEFDVTGPDRGPAVMLLHGFPDTGRLWRHQVPALAEAGFRVVVPDLRGYGRSDQPADVGAYAFPHLVADVLGVLDHLGIDRAHLVGHDWGAALGWVIAAVAPVRVEHLVALTVGHPVSFQTAGLEQYARSWYMLLFQFPGVAEQWLSGDGWANFRRWTRHPDTDAVIAGLEETGSLTPGLNYYRANFPPEAWISPFDLPAVEAPTLGVWASGDIFLTEAQMVGSEKYVRAEWHYERVDGAGHWLQLDAPERVNDLLLGFLPN